MERNPFGPEPDFGDPLPPERRTRSGCAPRMLTICLVVAGLAFICCCGGVVYFGMAMMTEEIAGQLRYHPLVLEHVGEVEEFDVNWVKSMNEDDNMDLWFYDVKGTKGRGVISCEHITNENGDEEIVSAELKLPDGRQRT